MEPTLGPAGRIFPPTRAGAQDDVSCVTIFVFVVVVAAVVVGCWLLVGWLLVAGCWLLVVGCWLFGCVFVCLVVLLLFYGTTNKHKSATA